MTLFLRSLIRNALGITGHFSVQNGAYHDVGKACFWYDEEWLKNGLNRFEREADVGNGSNNCNCVINIEESLSLGNNIESQE